MGQINLQECFTLAYDQAIAGKWGQLESVSGPGSTLQQTDIVRSFLPKILAEFNIISILDAPCGDFYWMQYVKLNDCYYAGIDIVEEMIEKNICRYRTPDRSFSCKDLLNDTLPYADLIISRDFFVHLSDADIYKALHNFKQSGAKYILTTTFPTRTNQDMASGGWRPINLQRYPFNFPEPLIIVNEQCTEQNGIYADKSLALWKLDDITFGN